ncbi:phage morphogenesis protein [Thalassotalea loyana]|uniref:Phage morphogenesis protein n=1 Tax=Thalassotalea loyana TaxID=280483 RepID=A0ABQ6HE37_9GAMM|nr:phage virion morphogenesis protein [Thalassotalea loyana]GLX86366.1 phage morphogenesis protein [Thalassotalea loyana]
MAGTFVDVQVRGDKAIVKRLNQISRKVDVLDAPLMEIGEYLLDNTQERFVSMQAPDGTPWEPLSETTLARKNRTDRILTESGTLADTLNYQLNATGLVLGSNMEYAAMHQFGGVTSSDSMMGEQEIPERAFLGVAPYEKVEILDILQSYLKAP